MSEKIKKALVVQGFTQALEVALYCSLIGILFWKGDDIFGKVPNYAGPVAFLILFIFSALTCALLVFYKPYKLFFADDKKGALDLVLVTTAFLAFFFLIFLLSAVFI